MIYMPESKSLPCVTQGCSKPAKHYAAILLPMDSKPRAPRLTLKFKKLAFCEEHLPRGLTVSELLTDQNWSLLVSELGKRGMKAPERELALLQWRVV